MDMVVALQTICVILIVIEYAGQISKLIKKKKVGSISWTYWIAKLLITALQIITLMICSTSLNAYISQVMSLILAGTVFSLMVYYHNHNKK